jgi:hypothetical protein
VRELGWHPINSRGLTPGGFTDCGYARNKTGVVMR